MSTVTRLQIVMISSAFCATAVLSAITMLGYAVYSLGPTSRFGLRVSPVAQLANGDYGEAIILKNDASTWVIRNGVSEGDLINSCISAWGDGGNDNGLPAPIIIETGFKVRVLQVLVDNEIFYATGTNQVFQIHDMDYRSALLGRPYTHSLAATHSIRIKWRPLIGACFGVAFVAVTLIVALCTIVTMVRRWRRTKLRVAGLCDSCCYQVGDSNRCAECGKMLSS